MEIGINPLCDVPQPDKNQLWTSADTMYKNGNC